MVYHQNFKPNSKPSWKIGKVKKISYLSQIDFMSYIYDVEFNNELHPVNHEFVFRLSKLITGADREFIDEPFVYFCKLNYIDFGLLTFGKNKNAKFFGQTSINEKIFLNLTSDN